ncbi:MAG: hypothetical protein ABWY52_01250 [Candidatus Limnocylindrales bacterium]
MRDQTAMIIDRATLEREVERIVGEAEAAGVTTRVLGSIGVALHCPDAADLLPTFARTYADIDFASYRRQARDLIRLLASLGYIDNRDVYITSEGSRSILEHPERRIHLDVFYDRLDFCHVIPLAGRLEADRPTIPLAELLLSKLQIVKINEKDVVDAILLLLDHPLGAGDAGIIDQDRIAAICAEDWGTWRTITGNLGKVATLAAGYPQLDEHRRLVVAAAVASLNDRLVLEPKTLAWRMRARVGDRRQWWTDVDEAI